MSLERVEKWHEAHNFLSVNLNLCTCVLCAYIIKQVIDWDELNSAPNKEALSDIYKAWVNG